jgi:hypothetical protein
MAISYILWSFGIFFPFWYVPTEYEEKSGNPVAEGAILHEKNKEPTQP